MIRGIRPLLRGSTYTGALFAYCGALASLPLLPFALLPLVMWGSAPKRVQILLVLLAWAVLVAAAGLARPVRRALVVSARRLLRVPLPDPVAGRRSSGSPRPDHW
ncbi:two-component sensor histidine kinase, partial [Streptomyces sp. NPDC023588]